MSKALTVQEGGDHYKRMKIQPLEYMLANEMPYIEGAVVKYVSRWRSKGGVLDLKKARHLLDVLIEAQEAEKPEDGTWSDPKPEAAPEPSPGVVQAFGLGAAPEGKAPFPMSWADRPKEPEEIPDWPFDYRPRALAVPASKTFVNADGALDNFAVKGDEILLYMPDYGWVWRKVRAEINNMQGRSYNVSTDGSGVSILIVPHNHVFCIRIEQGNYIGRANRIT